MRNGMTGLQIALVLGLCVFSSCGKKGEKLVIRVVFHVTGVTFAQPIKAGVEAAAKEFDVDARLVGPVDYNINEQVSIVENLIAGKVDGIATSDANAAAMNPIIEKAIAAGIPTITFNSQSPDSKALAFIGQDLEGSGRKQAELLAAFMDKKGKVLIFSSASAAAWSQAREKGFRGQLAGFQDLQVAGIVDTGTEEQTLYAAVENALMANPDLGGIATLDSATTTGVGRAILRLKKMGQIKHVGHDLMPETLENIKAGATQAALSQDPFKQGYLPVKMLVEHIRNKAELKSVDTGVIVVDKENVEKYLDMLRQGQPIG